VVVDFSYTNVVDDSHLVSGAANCDIRMAISCWFHVSFFWSQVTILRCQLLFTFKKRCQ